jgi:hypothetical protein
MLLEAGYSPEQNMAKRRTCLKYALTEYGKEEVVKKLKRMMNTPLEHRATSGGNVLEDLLWLDSLK